MKKYRKQIILLLIVIAIFLALRWSGIGEHLTLDNLKSNRNSLEQLVNSHMVFSVLAFILAYVVVVAFSIPGAVIMTLSGGFLFGTLFGAIYVNVGATIGAVLAFLSARYIIGNSIQDKYETQLKKFNSELEQNGHLYLLTLRFIPVFPFFLINFFSGLTGIPLRTFTWTTAVGIFPGSLVFTYTGSQLSRVNSVKDIISGPILLALVLLGGLSLIPAVVNKIRAKKQSAEAGK